MVATDKIHKNSQEKQRAIWSNSFDFFLSAVGYAVGIANVWRFPYLCYKNGGGVFLIPYFTSMFIIGMPMSYLEFIVGQFTSNGPLTAFRMVKITRGLGISMNIINSIMVIFLNMLIGYVLYFLVLSFTSELPWQKCNLEWSSPNCVDDFSIGNFVFNKCKGKDLFKCDKKGSLNFGRCFSLANNSNASCDMDRSLMKQVGYWKTNFPSADYWKNVILKQSDSIEESGSFVWQLVLSLFSVYFIVYVMVIKGIKVSGKAVYFTAVFPYIILLILGVRGWLLPGADIGISFYLTPKWEKLLEIAVWSDAATAVFFSIGISFGGMTTLASYNKFNSNIMRDAICLPLANCLTSFFAGFVIFAYMGYLSKITGQDIEYIIEAGQGLAFVVYPYAVTTLAVAPLWAILFFFMLLLLGLSSQCSNILNTITSILDAFPSLRSTSKRRYATTTIIFIVYFLLGLVFTLQSGNYWIEVFNTYSADWMILFLGATECLIVSFLYGLKNFRNDIEVMMGKKYTKNSTYYIWCALWSFITPFTIFFIILVAFTKIKKIQIGSYIFPDWTLYFGQSIQIVALTVFIGVAAYVFLRNALIEKKPISELFGPNFAEYIPQNKLDCERVRIKRGLYDRSTEDYFILSTVKLVNSIDANNASVN